MRAEYEFGTAELDLAIALQEEHGWWEPLPRFEHKPGSLEAKIVEVLTKFYKEGDQR